LCFELGALINKFLLFLKKKEKLFDNTAGEICDYQSVVRFGLVLK
jgi:hypothetical protein